MIVIADGGATKADWIALDDKGQELFYTQTLGINPEVVVKSDIVERIENNVELTKNKGSIKKIFFYGAGCGTPRMKVFLGNVLSEIFRDAEIVVKEDTYAATYATVDMGQKSIVCILGTGSNCNYWDGNDISQKVPSLGYILMDDCSGNNFGKQLIRGYYFNQMPKELVDRFSIQYNLEADAIKENLYKQPNPNKYLAMFARFLIDNRAHPYIRQIIDEGFKNLIENYIFQYEDAKKVPIHFSGSIGYYLADELKIALANHGLKPGKIVKRPIDGVVRFYNTYGLN